MFVPIGDDNRGRHTTPFVVWMIFAVNCFVWFLQLQLGEPFTNAFSAIPYELTHHRDLIGVERVRLDNLHSVEIQHYAGPSPIWLTAFSAMFMHGSWEHIIGNMMYLLIFADQIEDRLGHVRFLLFYIVCGLAASAAHVLFAPESAIPSLGASGAIAGVLGAYLFLYPGNQVRVMWMMRYAQVSYLPASIVLGGWILLQLVSQVSVIGGAPSGVAYMAHIGGFVAGALLLIPFLIGRRRPIDRY